MKRVYALYRVSTAKQVDRVAYGNSTKDEIPMQKIACHEFSESQHDWEIIREFEEKGVSGFKVSAENRDAIQDLKEAALHNEFDVLLVFMFDRLGRIENETPFVLQWFAEHGVEVWSVNEGQQKFENHVDKLMNYIRFWQASGESEKTSIRVKTRLEQMTEEGLYTGGAVPFGYTLVYNGRRNKKGQEMRDLAIEPHEAELVRKIFQMTVNEGYGSHQLAEYANNAGYRTHNGAEFQSNTIRRILKNEIYIGYIVNGSARSDRIESLRIVSDEDFNFAQEILSQRTRTNDEKRTIAMSNKGRALLSGNIFCAHCGCRLATSRYKERYIKRDGTSSGTEYPRYVCYHRSRGLNDCDGASTYNAEKVDSAVMDVMRKIFSNISGCPEEEKIQEAYKNAMAANHAMQKKLEAELQKNVKQLENLRGEIAKSLIGESIYNKEDLSIALDGIKAKIAENEKSLARLKDEDNQKKLLADSVMPAYRQFRSWAEEFEDA
ncbi:MAG: recombinase family protein, partial [Eubacteriales bacterium]